MASPMISVIVGSETGLLKGIDLIKGTWKNLNNVKVPSKANEITCLCWDDEKNSDFSVGLKSQQVAKGDVKSPIISEFTPLKNGKGVHLKAMCRHEGSLVTGFESGHVSIRADCDTFEEITTGSHLQCLTRRKNILGTGGKETCLKLYDMNTFGSGAAVFQAKNVRNDWLNLRVPIWVTGINFLEENKIVTSTGHHQVRVYDPRVQRRPVLDMTYDEYPITAMSLCGDSQVIVGNTQGSMGLLDIRKGKLVHVFKGFAGGIRSIQCHASLPVVASCGLDRFFRVHDINTKEIVHKMYLKSRLNCLLMTSNDWHGDNDDVTDMEEMVEKHITVDDDYDEDNQDDVWDNMQVVKTRTLKRKKIAINEEMVEVKKPPKRKAKTAKKIKR